MVRSKGVPILRVNTVVVVSANYLKVIPVLLLFYRGLSVRLA